MSEGHVYSVQPKNTDKRVLVMATSKSGATNFVHRETVTERLTSSEVVSAMRAGEEILSAAPPVGGPSSD